MNKLVFLVFFYVTLQGSIITQIYRDTTYIGCFNDTKKNQRLMGYKKMDMKLTPERCFEICKIKGFSVAGLQSGLTCFCSNVFYEIDRLSDTQCNLECRGNKHHTCGGHLLSQTFIMEKRSQILHRHFNGGTYLGCYEGPHELNGLKKMHLELVPQKCFERCKENKFAFAGLKAGIKCFCGNSLGKINKVKDDTCNTICKGNGSIACGGIHTTQIYELEPTVKETIETLKESNTIKSTFHGCFEIGYHRSGGLNELSLTSKKLTIKACFIRCKTKGFRYAGFQGGYICLCGNNYNNNKKVMTEQCNKKCSGNRWMTCGGRANSHTLLAFTQVHSLIDKQYERDTPYLGCFHDVDGSNDLNGYKSYGLNQTVDNCNAKCRQKGYRFSGLSRGKVCFCGNSYGKYGLASDNNCNLTCIGNREQKCGGLLYNQVYALELDIEKDASLRHDQETNYIGCYQDKFVDGSFDLNGHKFFSKKLTPSFCFKKCKELSFKYAGLQSGFGCFCGNSYGKYGKLIDYKCSQRCSGDLTQTCGGYMVTQVFEMKSRHDDEL